MTHTVVNRNDRLACSKPRIRLKAKIVFFPYPTA